MRSTEAAWLLHAPVGRWANTRASHVRRQPVAYSVTEGAAAAPGADWHWESAGRFGPQGFETVYGLGCSFGLAYVAMSICL